MADYPSSIPTIADAGANLSTNPHSSLHDQVRDELIAALNELGLAPSGTFSTVKARLDDMTGQLCRVYASAAARDAAITSPTGGMHAFLLDTNTLTVYSGSAWSTIGPVHGAATAWTPTLTQFGSVTFTTSWAYAARMGRLCFLSARLVVTGGSAVAANDIVIGGVPWAAANSSGTAPIGTGSVTDTSPAPDEMRSGDLILATSTTLKIRSSSLDPTLYLGSNSFSAALAANDVVAVQGFYWASADA